MRAPPTTGANALRPLLVACTVAIAVAGCGDRDGAASADDGDAVAVDGTGADRSFTVHLDQVVQSLEGGRNVVLEGYRSRVDNCRKAGIAVRAIPAADEHRLGTERWRMWRDATRYAYLTERWHVGQPENPASREDLCTFTLQRIGARGYVDARRSVSVDLATGARSDGDGDPGLVASGAAAATGHAGGGLKGPEEATVAGQPCNRWQARQEATLCVWSGGTRWGFSDGADSEFMAVDGLRPDYIVLEADPPPDAIGDQLRTTTFLVGAPLDADAMDPAAWSDAP
jgi:hypothetical protein